MAEREQAPAGCGSPGCPELLRHVGEPRSPLYLSFFEEECCAIAARLRLGAAAAEEPSLSPGEGSALWPEAAAAVTSTPLPVSPPLDGVSPDSAPPAVRPSAGGCEAPGPARGEPRRPPQPAAAARPGSRLARPQAASRKAARRGAGQPLCGGQGPAGRPRSPVRSPGRGGRPSLPRARASAGAELPRAGRGFGAAGTRIPQPAGAKLKAMPSAKAGPRHPGGAPQPAQPPALPAHTPRDAGRGGNVAPARRLTQAAVMAGGRRQPSRTLSTANPAVASHPRPRALGKVASPKRLCLGLTTREPVCNVTQELKENRESKEWEPVCNVTWELKENRESKERPVAAGTVLGADQAGLAPGCGGAVPAEQMRTCCSLWCAFTPPDLLNMSRGWSEQNLRQGATAAMNTTWQSSCRCEAWGVSRTPLQQHQAPKAGSAGDQLSQELKRVKNELEQVKGELADKTAQCEAYRRVICSLQAQLRAAGIHLEDVAVEESGDSGRK